VAFVSNVAVGTFNPKTLVFFVAFAPQFISATDPYARQAAMLVVTFGLIVACTDTAYVLLASQASRLARPAAALWSRRAGGGVLIAAGIATAAARR
jgi:threonine/homoserine/homoserine lactone efflux protein